MNISRRPHPLVAQMPSSRKNCSRKRIPHIWPSTSFQFRRPIQRGNRRQLSISRTLRCGSAQRKTLQTGSVTTLLPHAHACGFMPEGRQPAACKADMRFPNDRTLGQRRRCSRRRSCITVQAVSGARSRRQNPLFWGESSVHMCYQPAPGQRRPCMCHDHADCLRPASHLVLSTQQGFCWPHADHAGHHTLPWR